MSKASKEVNALHKELAELYAGQSTDVIRIKKLWAEIERLEKENEDESR